MIHPGVIRLRRAGPEDQGALIEIGRETFYDTFTGTCTEEDMQGFLDETYAPAQVGRQLSDPSDFFMFAEDGSGRILGYLRYLEDYGRYSRIREWKALECRRLYVRKEFQGTGVAQVLMDHFMKVARTGGYALVWLGVWEFNFRAQRFYSKYGFVPTGDRVDFPIGQTPQTDLWFWHFLD